jgi:hypothetical protein
MAAIHETPGYRMNVLIRRREGVTRDELVTNWFANHMPLVVRRTEAQAREGRPHAHRYIATLFDPPARGGASWDGIAQLWYEKNLPRPKEPIGTKPADTFQQKAAPYMPWMVREHVVLDGALPVTPNTLNEPFPFTRSGFFKVTFLIKTKPGVDHAAFVRHYLDVHAPNGARSIAAGGGFRYVVAHSVEPQHEEYASHAEVWFPNAEAWAASQAETKLDGIEDFIDFERTLVFTSGTEMVGIP